MSPNPPETSPRLSHDGQDSPSPGAPPPPVSTASLLASFALSEEVAAIVSEYLETLRANLPRLKPWRGFSSGCRVLGAHSVPDHSTRLDSNYSRVDVEIRVDAEQRLVALTCRRTVRGRDLRPTRFETPFDAAGRVQLAAWCEAELLSFASREFDRVGAGR
jgi:hypothetical protein